MTEPETFELACQITDLVGKYVAEKQMAKEESQGALMLAYH